MWFNTFRRWYSCCRKLDQLGEVVNPQRTGTNNFRIEERSWVSNQSLALEPSVLPKKAISTIRTGGSMRFLCRLFGCAANNHGNCFRCSLHYYDYGFVPREHSWLSPWYNLVQWLSNNRWYFQHRCHECQKQMFFSRHECCSEKCYDTWTPF